MSSERTLRILLCNHGLAHRGGTELYIRDVAQALFDRGHSPMVYSPILGPVAEEIRERGIPVVSDLSKLSQTPDIIHGQHHLSTLPALLHFPRTPGISFCHGYLHWLEAPLEFPRVYTYVAVDEICQERILSQTGIPKDRVRLLLNFADETRFLPRQTELPSFPKKALLLSNYESRDGKTETLREICKELGIELTQYGISSGQVAERPEELYREYDLVFAKARAALESLMVGTPVIPYQDGKIGPLVRLENLSKLRKRNIGFSTITQALSQSSLKEQLHFYNPEEMGKVAQVMREEATLENTVQKLLEIYFETLEFAKSRTTTLEQESLSVSRYLGTLSEQVLESGLLRQELEQLKNNPQQPLPDSVRLNEQLQILRDELLCKTSNELSLQEKVQSLEARVSLLGTQFHLGEQARISLEADLHQARLEQRRAQIKISEIENSRTIRVRNAFLKLPGCRSVVSCFRWLLPVSPQPFEGSPKS